MAAGLGGAALLQWQRSERAESAARAETARARSHELAASAVAVLEGNPSLAKALAIAGAEVAAPSFQSVSALHKAYAADRIVSRVSMNHFANRLWAVLRPDGTRVAMTAESAYQPALAVEVHDARSGDLIWERVRPDEPGHESAFAAGSPTPPTAPSWPAAWCGPPSTPTGLAPAPRLTPSCAGTAGHPRP